MMMPSRSIPSSFLATSSTTLLLLLCIIISQTHRTAAFSTPANHHRNIHAIHKQTSPATTTTTSSSSLFSVGFSSNFSKGRLSQWGRAFKEQGTTANTNANTNNAKPSSKMAQLLKEKQSNAAVAGGSSSSAVVNAPPLSSLSTTSYLSSLSAAAAATSSSSSSSTALKKTKMDEAEMSKQAMIAGRSHHLIDVEQRYKYKRGEEVKLFTGTNRKMAANAIVQPPMHSPPVSVIRAALKETAGTTVVGSSTTPMASPIININSNISNNRNNNNNSNKMENIQTSLTQKEIQLHQIIQSQLRSQNKELQTLQSKLNDSLRSKDQLAHRVVANDELRNIRMGGDAMMIQMEELAGAKKEVARLESELANSELAVNALEKALEEEIMTRRRRRRDDDDDDDDDNNNKAGDDVAGVTAGAVTAGTTGGIMGMSRSRNSSSSSAHATGAVVNKAILKDTGILQRLQEKLAEVTAAKEILSRQVAELKLMQEDARLTIAERLKEASSLRNELESLKKQQSSTGSATTTSTSTNQNNAQLIHELEKKLAKEVEKGRAALTRYDQSLAAKDGFIKILNEDLKSKSSEVMDLQSKVSSLTTDNQRVLFELSNLELWKGESEVLLQERERTVGLLMQDLDRLMGALEEEKRQQQQQQQQQQQHQQPKGVGSAAASVVSSSSSVEVKRPSSLSSSAASVGSYLESLEKTNTASTSFDSIGATAPIPVAVLVSKGHTEAAVDASQTFTIQPNERKLKARTVLVSVKTSYDIERDGVTP